MPLDAPRQLAQRGWFTKLVTPQHGDLVSYLSSRNEAHLLECIELPLASAVEAMRDLELMNVTPATLFPDLWGAAKQATLDAAMLRLELARQAERLAHGTSGLMRQYSRVVPRAEESP